MIFRFEDEDVLEVGEIPIEAFGDWPGLTTINVVVTRERHQHIITDHPEIADAFDKLVKTLLNPVEAHRDLKRNVLELYGWDGLTHAWAVIVRVALEEGLSNSPLTFYRTRRDRVEKRRRRADSVWRRE